LDSKNNGLDETKIGHVFSNQIPAFAVFDGMGGEQYGEIAAYIAAETFDNLYNNTKPNDI